MATTPVPSPARIGILGGGGIATAHLNAYATVADRAKVTASAAVDAEARSRRDAETGATGYADFKELVKDANVDAVDICLPHHLHTPAILAAAEGGRRVPPRHRSTDGPSAPRSP